MNYWHGKRAVITGGSAGLGRAIATALAGKGARVAIVARGQEKLDVAANELKATGANVLAIAADMTNEDQVDNLADKIESAWGGLDSFCHCAGRSMRGLVLDTPPAEFVALWQTNFLSALYCARRFAPRLVESRGHMVFIGSLASKVASAYLGAYPTSKFPLAALTQQMRIELAPQGLHTLLVCPGPIARRGDQKSGTRYADQAPDVPPAAHRPGGGAKVRAIDPERLAEKILSACERRQAELVVPWSARLLFAATQLSPRFGDWILRRMTTG